MIVEVVLDEGASPTEVDRVTELCQRHGFTGRAEPAFARRSAEVLPWVIQIVVGAPIAAFFVSFATEAGKDAYGGFKAWFRELVAARRESASDDGSLELIDVASTRLLMPSKLPDSAIAALGEVDWAAHTSGYVVWDDTRQLWYDPTMPSPRPPS